MKTKVTCIIPTFNSARYLRLCLDSLVQQDYPRNKLEVIIADGGSQDATAEIIATFTKTLHITVVNNIHTDAESGKTLGIEKAKGEIIVLLDSDNEVVHPEWLSTAVDIFKKQPKVWGVESPWLVKHNDSSLNRYFALMNFCDPVARLFAPQPQVIERHDEYDIIKVEKNQTPVTGANGFFWRKSIMKYKINDTNKFEETNYVSFLVSRGHTYYARLSRKGIYHYYCDSIGAYIKKRVKIANKFLDRKENNQTTWVDRVGPLKLLISALYNASIVGPSVQAVYEVLKTRQWVWMYHPVISFLTVAIYGYFFLKRSIVVKLVR